MIELTLLLVLVAIYSLFVVPVLATIAYVKIRRLENEKQTAASDELRPEATNSAKAPLPRFYRPTPREETASPPQVGVPDQPLPSSPAQTAIPKPTDQSSPTPPPLPPRSPETKPAGGSEIALIARWAPVIGAAFGIGALVFFGLYITQETTPLVRFLQMLSISAGLYVGGRFLQRYRPTFSAVITSMGLAALYFSAIAGYALPPVQVFENLTWAALAQILVLLWGLRESLRLQSSALATGMVGLGAISCVLLFLEGLFAGILPALLFLLTVAFALYRIKCWATPARLAAFLVTLGYLGYLILPAESQTPPAINLLLFPSILFLIVFLLSPTRAEKDILWARIFALLFLAVPGSLAIYFHHQPFLTGWLSLALGLTLTGLIESRWRGFQKTYEFSAVMLVILTACLLLHQLALQPVVPLLAGLSAALLILQKRYPTARLNDSSFVAWLIGLGAFVWYVFGLYEGNREVFYLTLLPSFLLLTGQLAWFPRRPAFRLGAAAFLAAGAGLLVLRDTFATEHLLNTATLLGGLVLALNFRRPAHCWSFLFLLLGGAYLIILFRAFTGIEIPAENWHYFPSAFALLGLTLGTGLQNRIIHLPWAAAVFLGSFWSTDIGPALVLLALVGAARGWRGPTQTLLEKAPVGWVLLLLSFYPILFTGHEDGPVSGYLFLPLVVLAWALSSWWWQKDRRPRWEPYAWSLGIHGLILAWLYLILPAPTWPGFPAHNPLPLLLIFLISAALVQRFMPLAGLRAGQLVVFLFLLGETVKLSQEIPLATLSALFLGPLLTAWLMERQGGQAISLPIQKSDWRRFSLLGTALLLLGVTLQSDPTWSTVQLGGAATILLLIGLWRQQQTIRVIGLVLFSLALVRLFIFDLQDNLHRIIAFGVVGGLCLLVGYLYQRAGEKVSNSEEQA
ncbi:MAG: DUF2339 domain-containing protein [Opitutales bacterium]|nr:DUF2339 domain-containing protein [Opitutales bacterium]